MMGKEELVACIVAAAGSGTRMGAPKMWLDLGGRPVLERTLCALEQSSVGEIVVAARSDEIARVEALCRGFSKVKAVVAGGETRAASVAAALSAVSEEAAYIAVHDGARPLVTPELVDRVIARARECGAAAPAVTVKDTLKQVDEAGRVVATPDRAALRAVQTPQVFAAALYRNAVASGGDFTDDCRLIEETGHPVYLCEGSYENLKITTPEDIPAALAILKGRGEA